MITAANIKQILYADPSVVTADMTPAIAKALIAAAITAKASITNVHGETWQLTEAEASVTAYKNALTGLDYRADTVMGSINPEFTIGQYDYATKAALMGGTTVKSGDNVVGWKRAIGKVIIYKTLFCLTEDDVWFIFPKCQILTREASTDKAIALPVKAYVFTPEIDGVAPEYNFDAAAVTAATAAA